MKICTLFRCWTFIVTQSWHVFFDFLSRKWSTWQHSLPGLVQLCRHRFNFLIVEDVCNWWDDLDHTLILLCVIDGHEEPHNTKFLNVYSLTVYRKEERLNIDNLVSILKSLPLIRVSEGEIRVLLKRYCPTSYMFLRTFPILFTLKYTAVPI